MVLVIQPNIMVVWRWIFECLFEATLPIIVTNSLVQAGVLGIYGLITAAPSEWKLVKGLNHVDGFVEIGWNHHLLDIKAYEKKRDFLRYYPYTLVQLFFFTSRAAGVNVIRDGKVVGCWVGSLEHTLECMRCHREFAMVATVYWYGMHMNCWARVYIYIFIDRD